MKISLSLIKSFLPVELSLREIEDHLTLLGIEVDEIINETPPFEKVIVGEVLSAKKHPDAAKLQIAEVDTGKEILQVVCGAPNCRPKMKTAFAVPGSTLRDAKGNKLTIEKASLRGVESCGMLCSAEELQLWKDSEGIMDLPIEWKNGADLTSLLWDPVFELSLTPNLGHALSAIGVARELAAKLGKKIQRSKTQIKKTKEGKSIKAIIEEGSLSSQYMGRIIENVTIAPSPLWLQKELLLCGLKPICNVVDVTNYILLKNGQPLHAFDLDQIEGGEIRVEKTKKEETLTLLDKNSYEIPKNTLVISDTKKILAIAGVMGGQTSSVQNETRNIFLEAAIFNPVLVRKAGKSLGLRTDSLLRFEKGVDPEETLVSLEEATSLIQTLCGGEISDKKTEITTQTQKNEPIKIRTRYTNKLLGTNLSKSEIQDILKRLDCRVSEGDEDSLLIEPPSYRFDLNVEVELIEEVLRIYGYNHLESSISRSTPSQIPHDSHYLFEKKIRSICTKLGLSEFLNSDLISPKLSSLCTELTCSQEVSLLKATYAKTEEYSILRPSLLPGILQSVKNNLDVKNTSFAAFEIGRIHFLEKKKPIEIPMLSFAIVGSENPPHFSQDSIPSDFYTLKGLLENLFDALKVEGISYRESKHSSFHPTRQAEVHLSEMTLGTFGELHPNLLKNAGIKGRVLFSELDLESLLSISKETSTYKSISPFPASSRDWTIPLKEKVSIGDLLERAKKEKPPILESIEVIDLYAPKESNERNATLRFTYRNVLKTLSFEEVEEAHLTLVKNLQKLVQ